MSPDRQSRLIAYSLGIVVTDKPRDTHEIEVSPIEDLPTIEKKLKDYKPEYSVQLPDAQGVSRQSKTSGLAYIKAIWLPLSQTNRKTSPDVIKNETILLYRYSDSETYYWDTLFDEPHIRRLETVLYMFGNLKEPLKKWDKKSSYWYEISTHDKHIHLKTTKSDGEPFEYDVKIDTAKGNIVIHDDVGNIIKFDSAKDTISAKANKEILLQAPTVRFKADHVINDAPVVTNTGDEKTKGSSYANPHYKAVD